MNGVKKEDELAALKRELNVLSRNSSTQKLDLARKLMEIGSKCLVLESYDEAAEYINRCLTTLKEIQPPNKDSLILSAFALNGLGQMYTNQGKFDKALKNYKLALEMKKQTLPPDHTDIADSFENIGVAYASQMKFDKALEYFNKSLEIQNKHLSPVHPSIAETYINIGSMHSNQDNHEKGLEYFFKALAIQKQTLPSTNLKLSTTLDNIGSAYANLQKLADAAKYFKQSLVIKKINFKSDHPAILSTLDLFAPLYLRQEKYEEALKYYKEAFELRNKTGTNGVELFQDMHTLMFLAEKLGKTDEIQRYIADMRDCEHIEFGYGICN